MTIYLTYIAYTIWLVAEIYFVDPYFWKQGKTDKPWSTIYYLVGCAWFGFLLGHNLWEIGMFAICVRAIFDPLLNISGSLPSGRRHVCYHTYKNLYEKFWYKIPCNIELLIRILVYIFPLMYFISK